MEFLEYLKTQFSDPEPSLSGSGGRPHGRSDPSRSIGRSTDVHSLVHVGQAQGTVDRVGRPARELCKALWFWAVDRLLPTVKNMTVGGRPAGRPPAVQAEKYSLTANLVLGLYIPHLIVVSSKIFRAKNFRSLLVF